MDQNGRGLGEVRFVERVHAEPSLFILQQHCERCAGSCESSSGMHQRGRGGGQERLRTVNAQREERRTGGERIVTWVGLLGVVGIVRRRVHFGVHELERFDRPLLDVTLLQPVRQWKCERAKAAA